MEYIEFKKSRIRALLEKINGERFAVYGSGANAAHIIALCSGKDFILIDDVKAGQYWNGLYLHTITEALILNIKHIIIAAQIDSSVTVFNRIAGYAIPNGIHVYDIYGNDLIKLRGLFLGNKRVFLPIDKETAMKKAEAYEDICFHVIGTLFNKFDSIEDSSCASSYVPRSSMLELARRLSKSGKHLHFILDQELQEQELRQLLSGEDIDCDTARFYSVHDQNEYYKGLYHSVLQNAKGSVLHFGTDEMRDVWAPSVFGIAGFRILTSEELFKSSLYNEMKTGWIALEKGDQVWKNFVAKAFSDPFIYKDIKIHLLRREEIMPVYDDFRNLFADDKNGTIPEGFPCVLVMDCCIPRPDCDTGSRLSLLYQKLFVRMGYTVYFLPQYREDENEYSQRLENEGIHVLNNRLYEKYWIQWLTINGDQFKCVFVQRPSVAVKYLDAVLLLCKQAKIIYHPADLHFLRIQRQAELEKNDSLKEQSLRQKETEYRIFSKVNLIYPVGSFEAEYLQKQFPEKTVRNIPVLMYEADRIKDWKPAEDRDGIVFVGGFGHLPNVDAVKWLAEEIMPAVHQLDPNIKCHIVGSNPPDSFKEYANDYFKIEGFLTDESLEQMYHRCRLAVVPLRFGAGVKGKIIEAAFHHVPVVTTSIGAEGIPNEYEFMVIQDESRKFAEEIVSLYQDVKKIDAMSIGAEQTIRKYYTVDCAEKILREDLEDAL